MHRYEVFHESAQSATVLKRRLDRVLEICHARLARPCVGVVEIAAVINGAAFKDNVIVLFADDGRYQRHNVIQIRMIMRSGESQTVNVLRILMYFRLRDGALQSLRE